jgi:hydrogenase maturation protease
MSMGNKKKSTAAKLRRTARLSPKSAAGFKVLVIGMGNPLRGDDAAGRIVADRIQRRNQPFLNVVECSGEAAALMELWRDAGVVIVVDAVAPSRGAGIVQRFDATERALPVRFYGASTHAFGLGEAVELARALHQLPHRLIVFGIEGERFHVGSRLSPGVKKAVPRVAALVVAEARRQLKVESSFARTLSV